MSETTFNCFSSSTAAFSPDNNCLYFTILLIYTCISILVIFSLALALCCAIQNNVAREANSEETTESSDEDFQVNPFANQKGNVWNVSGNNQSSMPRLNYNESAVAASQANVNMNMNNSQQNQMNLNQQNQQVPVNLGMVNPAYQQQNSGPVGQSEPELEALKNMIKSNPALLQKLMQWGVTKNELEWFS